MFAQSAMAKVYNHISIALPSQQSNEVGSYCTFKWLNDS